MIAVFLPISWWFWFFEVQLRFQFHIKVSNFSFLDEFFATITWFFIVTFLGLSFFFSRLELMHLCLILFVYFLYYWYSGWKGEWRRRESSCRIWKAWRNMRNLLRGDSATRNCSCKRLRACLLVKKDISFCYFWNHVFAYHMLLSFYSLFSNFFWID